MGFVFVFYNTVLLWTYFQNKQKDKMSLSNKESSITLKLKPHIPHSGFISAVSVVFLHAVFLVFMTMCKFVYEHLVCVINVEVGSCSRTVQTF